MDTHRVRNVIPPLYGILIVVGFIISATVGIIVIIAGAVVSGLLWSALSGGSGGRNRDRARNRARR